MSEVFPAYAPTPGGVPVAAKAKALPFGGFLTTAGPHALAKNTSYAISPSSGLIPVANLPDVAGLEAGDQVVIGVQSFLSSRVEVNATGAGVLSGLGPSFSDGDTKVHLQGIAAFRFIFGGAALGNPWVLDSVEFPDPTNNPHHRPVTVATTAALPAYTASGTGVDQLLTADANGQLTVDGLLAGGGFSPIDGANGGVLVKNEAAGARIYHGVWNVIDAGDGSNPWVLQRRPDFAFRLQTENGAYFKIQEGVANAGKTFIAPLEKNNDVIGVDWIFDFIDASDTVFDPDALHDNIGGEIVALGAVTPVGADVLVLEDASDSDNKKKVVASDLMGADTVDDQTVQTTTATIATIATYATLADDKAINFKATIVGREDATDDLTKVVVEGAFNRDDSSVVTQKFLDNVSFFEDAGAAAWAVTFVISGQDILVRVTGEAAHTINWRCHLRVSES